MPQNKLQHYVPKCHLRPFCSEPDGSAINLYNIARNRLIESAPIKGQCARDYFYGKDGLLERALQNTEGAYASIVAKAALNPTTVTAGDLSKLREFALLQSFRTYGYIEKLIMLSDQHHAKTKWLSPGIRVFGGHRAH